MTQNQETKAISTGFINTKFGKVLLTVISVILVFVGPTYFIYGLTVLLKVDLAASFAVGFVLFIIGLVMMRYLVKNKVIS